MILTKEDRSAGRKTKTCLSVTLSTTHFTSAVQVMNPGLRGEQLRTNRLRHDMATQRFTYNPVLQSDFHIGILALPPTCHPILYNHTQVTQLADTVW